MRLKDLENRAVAIWGLGREGLSALKFLQKHLPDQEILLINQDQPSPDVLASPHVRYVPEDRITDLAAEIEVLIKSPGISLYRPEVSALRDAGVEITSATNIFFALPHTGKTITITGSNGKSTCTSLLHHILTQLGHDSRLGGNIGTPLLDLLDGPEPDFWCVELSSYQTADFTGQPDLAAVLNLYPEHIQWHQNHAQYFDDKLNLIAGPDTTALLNHTDDRLRARFEARPNTIWFNHPNGLHLAADQIKRGTETIGERTAFPSPGNHNAENLCAVLAICDHLGLDASAAFKAACSYPGLPHRLQPLGKIGDHHVYNDSISTTPEATIAALQALDRSDITLICGGENRAQDYTKLADYLAENPIHAIITMYETGPQIAKALEGHNTHPAKDFNEAVAQAKTLTPKGGTILLSPAAPSYDAFKNFEDRGEQFMRFVNTLILSDDEQSLFVELGYHIARVMWQNIGGEDPTYQSEMYDRAESVYEHGCNIMHSLGVFTYDKSKNLYYFAMPLEEVRSHLKIHTPKIRYTLDEIIGKFFWAIDYQGDLSTEKIPFIVPEHLQQAMLCLVKMGFATKIDDEYQWTEKIEPIMIEEIFWTKEGESLQTIQKNESETLFQEMWNTLPTWHKHYLARWISGKNEMDLMIYLYRRWDGQKYSLFERRKGKYKFPQQYNMVSKTYSMRKIAKRLIEIRKSHPF